MPGTFITFYGINNIGKSTHALRVVEKLNAEGRKAKYVKFPIYDLEPTGPFLNGVLRGADGQKISEDELQMWFVLNRYQFQPELERLLGEGYIVVAEDYTGTGIAWGMAKGLEMSWLEELNKFLRREDFSILFEGERDVTAMEKQHVHETNEELVQKCVKTHQQLGDKYKWNRVQVQPDKEETAKLVWELIDGLLNN